MRTPSVQALFGEVCISVARAETRHAVSYERTMRNGTSPNRIATAMFIYGVKDYNAGVKNPRRQTPKTHLQCVLSGQHIERTTIGNLDYFEEPAQDMITREI